GSGSHRKPETGRGSRVGARDPGPPGGRADRPGNTPYSRARARQGYTGSGPENGGHLMRSRPLAVVAVLAALLGGALLITSPQALETFQWEYAVAGPRPQRDTTFGARILRLSEEGGYFDTDNLISNERSYLHVAPALRSR